LDFCRNPTLGFLKNHQDEHEQLHLLGIQCLVDIKVMHLEAALKFGPAFIYNVPGRTGQDWLFQQEHLLPFLNVNLSILDAAGHQARCDHENQRSSELHRCQGLVKREEPSGEEMFMVLVARVRRNSVVRQECMGHERIKESCLRRRNTLTEDQINISA